MPSKKQKGPACAGPFFHAFVSLANLTKRRQEGEQVSRRD
jgi:hypothetical protein